VSALAAEIIFYVWLFITLPEHGWHLAAVLLLVVVIASCWRLSHAAGSATVSGVIRFWQGRRDVGMVKAFTIEFVSRLISFNVTQPFVQWVMPHEPMLESDATPVLLVHGYFCNRGIWATFCARLRNAESMPIYTYTFSPPFGKIETFAMQLHARIEAICEATGQKKIILIAHSMGGLVVRKYMLAHGRARVAHLITIGSPHHGTKLAYFGIGKCAQQMRPNSRWLQALAVGEHKQLMPPTTAIYTINDDVSYPPESSSLAWATNIAVRRVGHVGLLFSAEVAAIVLTLLAPDKNKPP